ncbi:MAG: tetratricopeptide repeat protein [Parachlamydia sp.]|nr:tetratricopeptide repeat protein [Parachlamydia sp.]
MLDPAYELAEKQFVAAIAQAAQDEALSHPQSALPAKMQGERAALVAEEASKQFLITLRKGVVALLSEMKNLSKDEEAALLQELKDTAISAAKSDQLCQRLYPLAKSLLDKRCFQEAADAFYFLIAQQPDISLFWLGLGIAEHEKHNFEEALLAYEQTLTLDSSLSCAYLYMAECTLASGDPAQAEAILKSLKSLDEKGDQEQQRLQELEKNLRAA